MKLHELYSLKTPPSLAGSKLPTGLSIVAPLAILLQRIVFILQGWFDIETPIIIDGLKHPWLIAGEAPYGAIWYAINIPLAQPVPILSPEQSWLILTSIVDAVVLFLLFRYHQWWIGAAYIPSTILMWRQAPYNLSIMWLAVGGLAWLPSLGLAILAKFPVGAPSTVWTFVSHSSQLQSNWRYYALLAAVWLGILYVRVRDDKPILPSKIRSLILKVTGI